MCLKWKNAKMKHILKCQHTSACDADQHSCRTIQYTMELEELLTGDVGVKLTPVNACLVSFLLVKNGTLKNLHASISGAKK